MRKLNRWTATAGEAMVILAGALALNVPNVANAAGVANVANVANAANAASAAPAAQGAQPSAPLPEAALRRMLQDASTRAGLDLLDDQCGKCLLARWDLYSSMGSLPGWTEAAAATARLAIAASQTSPEILTAGYNRLGMSLRWMEDFPRAEEAFRQAAGSAGAERQAALANLAEVERLEGHNAEALADARRSLALPLAGRMLKDPLSLLCRLSPPEVEKDAPLRAENSVTKPEKIVTPPPVYSEAARKARLSGTVVIEVVIGRDGCVRDAKVLKGLELGLDRAALDAVSEWVFKPATLDGKPVKVYYTLTVSFQVQPDSPRPGAPGRP
jgi:TonB family protein